MSNSEVVIHAERLIEADVASVWRALRASRWGWSSFMHGLEADCVGNDATLRLRGLPSGIPIPVRLLALEPEREIRWGGGIEGVFFGEHYVRLHAVGNATRVEHGEIFSGLVGSPVARRMQKSLTKRYALDITGLAAAASDPNANAADSVEVHALPDSLSALTPAWLESLLRARHPHARVREVTLVKASHAGDGLASTADRLAIDVRYEEGHDDGLPTRMLLKTILLGRGARLGPGVIRFIAHAMDGIGALPLGVPARDAIFRGLTRFQERFPQAPDAMYENEVRFYREIRPELRIETPATYASLRDPRTRRFGVLMEDLGQRHVRFPTALDALTAADMRTLLSTLARLHAHFWRSPRLERDLAWVPTSTSGDMFAVFDGLGLELIRAQLDLYPFKKELVAPLGRSLDAMWAATWETQREMAAAPQTLLHGDVHIANTYLVPGGGGGLLDWQLMMRGCYAHDVTYVLANGLPTDVRRREERSLLAHYLRELEANGVSNPPTLDEAFAVYRRAISWGLVIGWLITPPQNYGVEVTTANLRRMATAAMDLGTFEPDA